MTVAWEIRSLGDVCDVIGGGTPSKANKKFYGGDIPWATVRDMRGEFIEKTEHTITKEAVNRCATNIIPKGNVVIATRVGLGKVCLLRRDTAINQDLRGIVPKVGSNLHVGYLNHWLKSVAHLIVEKGTGATVQGVKLPFVKSLQIPRPPLSEQKRIVSILDKAFAAIAAAKEIADRNLRSAHELFRSQLDRSFSNISGNWSEKPLAELCLSGRVITYGVVKLGPETDSGVPCLRTSNVRWLSVDSNFVKSISRSLSDQYSRTILRGQEVLVNVRGTLGGVAVASENMKGWNVSREIAVVPVDPNKLYPQFLAYCVGSRYSQDWLTGKQKGAAYVGINIEDLRKLPVRFPKLREQIDFVKKLAVLQENAKELEKRYEEKIETLSELKRSVLQKAFSGELVGVAA